jgi:hypothetical protein
VCAPGAGSPEPHSSAAACRGRPSALQRPLRVTSPFLPPTTLTANYAAMNNSLCSLHAGFSKMNNFLSTATCWLQNARPSVVPSAGPFSLLSASPTVMAGRCAMPIYAHIWAISHSRPPLQFSPQFLALYLHRRPWRCAAAMRSLLPTCHQPYFGNLTLTLINFTLTIALHLFC